jgi:gliding motility-associated-like protein
MGKRATATGMRGTLTKLLTVTTLSASLFSPRASGQCALITDNYSGQVAGSVCAPVNLNMDVRYKFILPVDPSKVQILYVWNDGTGATTTVPAITHGDTVFTATASHIYPPADQCSYTAEAYVIYDGQQCVSSSRQEQTFSAWARDNQNGAVVITDPVIAQFCEGEDIIDVRFRDNSTFNCNINVEPDKPNRITRWVQFIYGTHTIGGDRIPNITIRDPLGNVYQMTDAAGNSLPPVSGPIVEIPIPADGPTEISWPISAPAGGVAGDIFEITLRNWNICNPYDRNPFDAIPPTDPVNGDYPPITNTALIEIITTPPEITNPSLEFCAGSPIHLTLSTSGGQVNWYTDSLLTHHIHTGPNFDPTGAPTYIDNSTGGTYSYWVTETIGACASAPSRVSFTIYDTPAPAPNAGPDAAVCSNSYTLRGNTPVIGIGEWTTTSSAIISDPSNPTTMVTNLQPGPNLFRWTIRNGPCVSVDEVVITSDRQPDPADAGPDQSFCNTSNTVLHAHSATNNGIGTWTVSSGNASFNDIHSATATASAIAGGENRLVWTVRSQYGVCVTTADSMYIMRDRSPSPANAGPDRGVCDSSAVKLGALPVNNGGSGTWTVLSGGAMLADVHDAATDVSNLSFGNNTFRWTIVSQYGICPGSNDQVIITRDQAPDPALAGDDQDLCSSVTAPLGANAATIGTGTWTVVWNPSAVAPVFAPGIHSANATVQIQPGNEGIYRFAWTIVNNSCRTSDSLTVDFGKPVVPANAGPSDSVCGTAAVLHGNLPGTGTGTWTKVAGTGNVNFIPGIHSPSAIAEVQAGQEGVYSYEWRITSGSCPPTADTVTVLYKPTPGMPSSTDVANCGPASMTLASVTGTGGDINRWYPSSTGGIMIIESPTLITSVLTNDADYWVSTYNFTTGCESNRQQVHVDINPVPDPPAVSDIQHCGSTSLTLSSVTGKHGTTGRWYDAPSGGNLLATADTFISPVLTAPVTYYISSYNETTGCESNRTPLNVRIDPVPDIPVASDTSRCGEGILTIQSLPGLNGTQNQWYDSPTGNVIDTSLNFTTPYLTATTPYWISTINNLTGCRSPRIRVWANINPVPGFPSVNDVTLCGPDTVRIISVPGVNGTISRWYDSITGGNFLAQDDIYIPGLVSTTSRYFVSTYNQNTHCESSRKPVNAVILPVPPPNTIIGPDAVGINQTNVIYSVNFHPGSTYEWFIPPGIDSLLQSQNFVMLGFPNLGTYNLSVTETNSIGCQGPPANKPVQVKADVILLDISASGGRACLNNDLPIFVSPSGGTPSYSFAWGGATQYLNSTNVSNPVFNSPVAGSFMLTVTVNDINLNHSTDTIWVTVRPDPLTQISVPDTMVCSGSDLQLHGMATGGSGTYSSFTWTGQTMPLSATDIADPVFNTYLPGTYRIKLTVIDDFGCQDSDSVNILNDSPQAVFSSDARPACSPLPVNFLNSSLNAVDYLWNFGDGQTSTDKDPVHVFNNTTNSVQYYNVQLTAISGNHCIHSFNDYITVYPNPELSINTYPEMACAPADILLSSTPGGHSYNWDFGDGNQASGDFNIMHTFNNDTDHDTTFTILLSATSYFGCTDSGTTSIVVHPSPEALFTADPLSQMIPDRIVNFHNNSQPGNWDYLWRFGDDSTSIDRDPGSHEYPGPGRYLVYLIVKGTYCSDSTWVNIEIVPHPPIAAFKPIEPGCLPLTIQFENTSAYSNSFLWEFGDGSVSNKPNPEYTYYEPGTYTIKLTAWGDNGTADSYSTNNDVYVLPNAFFDIKPRRVYANEQTVLFKNESDNGTYPLDGNRYLWDFGDGTGSEEENPQHVYKKDGSYNVILNVWTNKGCYDVYEYQAAVLVEPIGKIVFPNVFSPEAELQENRIFKPGIIDYVADYHLMIFNRWGEFIFESFSQDVGWDGMINGKVAKEDVYIWKVEGKYTNGQVFVLTGDVTLLR